MIEEVGDALPKLGIIESEICNTKLEVMNIIK